MSEKIKILIIDDDENVRGMYVDIFKQNGFEVIEAEDGVSGLDKATKEIPQIILTGIIMPRMDGFGLKEALTKNVATANIPVIMISHMGREEDRKKAEELGVKYFIVQGMTTPKQVVEKVNALFGSGKYRINFSKNDLEAQKLAQDFQFDASFKCAECSSEMIMEITVTDSLKKEFKGRLLCPVCEKK